MLNSHTWPVTTVLDSSGPRSYPSVVLSYSPQVSQKLVLYICARIYAYVCMSVYVSVGVMHALMSV